MGEIEKFTIYGNRTMGPCFYRIMACFDRIMAMFWPYHVHGLPVSRPTSLQWQKCQRHYKTVNTVQKCQHHAKNDNIMPNMSASWLTCQHHYKKCQHHGNNVNIMAKMSTSLQKCQHHGKHVNIMAEMSTSLQK